MKEYLRSRLADLRKLYRDTGEGEYLYRTLEVQRALLQIAIQERPLETAANDPRTQWQTLTTKGQTCTPTTTK
jgi:hypothetical protein